MSACPGPGRIGRLRAFAAAVAFTILCVMAACGYPYKPLTEPVLNGETADPAELEDRYERSGPPKLLLAPVLDIQVAGADSISVGVEAHGNVPKVLALTGYAGYSLMGSSDWRVEAYAGFPLFRSSQYVVGAWALGQTATTTTTTTTYQQVNIPVHTMFIVEGGFRVQNIKFANLEMGRRADRLSDSEFSGSTIGYLRAGIRRKTFWSVKQADGSDTARSMGGYWLHAVLPPVGVPDPLATGDQTYYQGLFGNGAAADGSIGGAFGMEFPAWVNNPFLFRTEVAILPGPHRWELMVGINYLFEVL